MASFTVHTAPKGKARARTVRSGGKVHSYTPQETKDFEKLVAYEYKTQCREYFEKMKNSKLKLPLEVEIHAYFAIPKSFTKGKRLAAECNRIRPTVKPDCDNIAKAVCDALNKIAYDDDSQITVLSVLKLYTTEEPRLEITIRECL